MATHSVSSTSKRAAAAFLALTVTAVTLIHSTPAQASTTDAVIDAQMLVYEINEARRDPDAFKARASELTMPSGIPARPPLAISPTLGSSSMFKANELADYGYFAHQSAVTGIWPNRLARDHGYPLPGGFADDVNNIESLHGGSPDPFWVLASFANSPSHRRHIFGEGDFFGAHRQIGVGRSTNENYWTVHTAYANPTDVFVTGVVYNDANGNGRMDRGEGLGGVTVSVNGTTTTTNAGGGYATKTTAGSRSVSASGGGFSGLSSTQVSVGSQNVGVDFVSGQPSPLVNGSGSSSAPASWASSGSGPLCSDGTTCDTVVFVDPGGRWYRYAAAKASAAVKVFYYGNPGDVPFTGDWHGTGTATPGLYRRSDGFAYLRNSNTQGNADVTFYFGNPSDVPLAGDFNGSGRDSLAIYRPDQTRVFIINKLGENGKGLGAADYSFLVGNPGDQPFVGDFDGDGVDTIGIYRPSSGWVYLRNSNSAGPAHESFNIGTGWDFVFAGDWDGDGVDTLAAYRRSTGTVVFAAENSGNTVGYSLAVGWFPWAVVAPQA
jgi:uncharacterized protein YkwD